jgi:hypothetical protein
MVVKDGQNPVDLFEEDHHHQFVRMGPEPGRPALLGIQGESSLRIADPEGKPFESPLFLIDRKAFYKPFGGNRYPAGIEKNERMKAMPGARMKPLPEIKGTIPLDPFAVLIRKGADVRILDPKGEQNLKDHRERRYRRSFPLETRGASSQRCSRS